MSSEICKVAPSCILHRLSFLFLNAPLFFLKDIGTLGTPSSHRRRRDLRRDRRQAPTTTRLRRCVDPSVLRPPLLRIPLLSPIPSPISMFTAAPDPISSLFSRVLPCPRRNCSEKKKENSNPGKACEQVFFS
ncbi:hypothetical protein LXL04_013602 [Taraxacum kok-saghyz]